MEDWKMSRIWCGWCEIHKKSINIYTENKKKVQEE